MVFFCVLIFFMNLYLHFFLFIFSFLWRIVDGSIQVFTATGDNDYLVLNEQSFFAFGGG
jgi:hypothetical protein